VRAEHRAAVKAYHAASEIDGNLETGTPEWDAANAVTQAATKRERATIEALRSKRRRKSSRSALPQPCAA
jgi:hypothetical protein